MGSQLLLTSDLVVVLKTLPTREAIDQLGNRLKQDLQTESPENEVLSIQSTDYGLSLENETMAVHLLLTTIPANWHSLDSSIHLDRWICKRNFNAIKHAKWVDEVCIHPSNKVLVRLLKDLRQRFPGLEPLNPWLINLLAHHCVTNNNNSTEQLPPSYAFKRALQLLSSGLFLPGSNGLHDPFNDANINSSRSQSSMTFEEQDRLCSTSQTLLRALAIHPKYVLGLENGPDIFAGPCQLNGILFTPSEPLVFNNDSNGYSTTDPQQLVEVNS
jgi:interleukin enhancer-binding factor 2